MKTRKQIQKIFLTQQNLSNPSNDTLKCYAEKKTEGRNLFEMLLKSIN